jgi:predicted XRE-type DNA-binding protein
MRDGVAPKGKKKPIEVEAGSGNVFADLALTDADEQFAKGQLAQRIGRIIAALELTQARAAALLQVNQPKVSALLRGRLDGFSTDQLFRFLNTLAGRSKP